MNVKKLQQDWIDYHKTGIYEGLRFGQYVFNERGYQVDDSYNIEDANLAYSILFNSLTFEVSRSK